MDRSGVGKCRAWSCARCRAWGRHIHTRRCEHGRGLAVDSHFGNVTLGDFTELPFTLTNTGATSITTGGIFTMGGDGSDFSTPPETDCTSVDSSGAITMAPGDVCTIDVVFAPGVRGIRNMVLILEDSGGFTADFVDVTGVGTIGYYQVGAQGAVGHAAMPFSSGMRRNTSRSSHRRLAVTGDDGGYWLVASDGGVFNHGPSAGFHGSAGAIAQQTHCGNGRHGRRRGVLVGGVRRCIFSYGDANFYGSTGSIRLNKPIVGMAPTPDGGGYWLVASDGGIFNYGDANFYGSAGSLTLNKPIVGMAPTPTGAGTGWWRPTAGSSPTETPSSTAPPAPPGCRSRSWVWRRCPMGSATGSARLMAAFSTTAPHRSKAAGSDSASGRSSAWRPTALPRFRLTLMHPPCATWRGRNREDRESSLLRRGLTRPSSEPSASVGNVARFNSREWRFPNDAGVGAPLSARIWACA